MTLLSGSIILRYTVSWRWPNLEKYVVFEKHYQVIPLELVFHNVSFITIIRIEPVNGFQYLTPRLTMPNFIH